MPTKVNLEVLHDHTLHIAAHIYDFRADGGSYRDVASPDYVRELKYALRNVTSATGALEKCIGGIVNEREETREEENIGYSGKKTIT